MTEQKGLAFRFGEFEVREGEFCLSRGEETIPVEPKAFRVLLYLLHKPHRLVTKDELLDAVWQETSVSENSLTRAVALLRRLLGDDTPEPRFIATVPTVGYRFVAAVNVSDSAVPVPLMQPQRRASSPRHTTLLLLSSGCAIILLLVLLFVVMRHHVDRHGSAAAAAFPAGHSYELLSVHGLMSVPMLSPDAREMAFIWNSGNSSSDLYVQLIRGDRQTSTRCAWRIPTRVFSAAKAGRRMEERSHTAAAMTPEARYTPSRRWEVHRGGLLMWRAPIALLDGPCGRQMASRSS